MVSWCVSHTVSSALQYNESIQLCSSTRQIQINLKLSHVENDKQQLVQSIVHCVVLHACYVVAAYVDSSLYQLSVHSSFIMLLLSSLGCVQKLVTSMRHACYVVAAYVASSLYQLSANSRFIMLLLSSLECVQKLVTSMRHACYVVAAYVDSSLYQLSAQSSFIMLLLSSLERVQKLVTSMRLCNQSVQKHRLHNQPNG